MNEKDSKYIEDSAYSENAKMGREKVYCKDCEHFLEKTEPIVLFYCNFKTKIDTWREPMVVNIPPENKNKNNDCSDFVSKNKVTK